jgi:hypothetical protein
MQSVFDYRGIDKRAFKAGNLDLCKRNKAMVKFEEPLARNLGRSAYGSAFPSKDDPPETKSFEVSFRTGTQMPSILIVVTMADGTKIQYRLYANHLEFTDREVGLAFFFGRNPDLLRGAPDDSKIHELAAAGQLLRIDVCRKPGADGLGMVSSDTTKAAILCVDVEGRARAEYANVSAGRPPHTPGLTPRTRRLRGFCNRAECPSTCACQTLDRTSQTFSLCKTSRST